MALNSKSLGRQIKRYRSEKKISQEELGNMVFSTREHISYIETGERLPSLEMIVLIANALETSLNDLLAEDLIVLMSDTNSKIQEIFLDCNHVEKTILMNNLQYLKSLLREQDI